MSKGRTKMVATKAKRKKSLFVCAHCGYDETVQWPVMTKLGPLHRRCYNLLRGSE